MFDAVNFLREYGSTDELRARGIALGPNDQRTIVNLLVEQVEFANRNQELRRARRPFHPERLKALFASEWPGVIRSKGFFWLATRMAEVGEWAQAGAASRTSRAGLWWAAIRRSAWPTDEAEKAEILCERREPYGDRRQELVLIGINMDEAGLRAALNRSLLTDEELAAGPKHWKKLHDPFPDWNQPGPVDSPAASA